MIRYAAVNRAEKSNCRFESYPGCQILYANRRCINNIKCYNNRRGFAMSKRSDGVKKWRKSTKDRIVEAMGGECVCCGYNKCHSAMDLHHISPTEKEFAFSDIMARPRAWSILVEELRKCVLVCNRCHREIHSNVTKLPDDIIPFDESFADYRSKEVTYCLICGNEKDNHNITCSKKCAAKRSRKVDWELIDLGELLKSKNFSNIGDMLGISDTAVRKRAKKLKLI